MVHFCKDLVMYVNQSFRIVSSKKDTRGHIFHLTIIQRAVVSNASSYLWQASPTAVRELVVSLLIWSRQECWETLWTWLVEIFHSLNYEERLRKPDAFAMLHWHHYGTLSCHFHLCRNSFAIKVGLFWNRRSMLGRHASLFKLKFDSDCFTVFHECL